MSDRTSAVSDAAHHGLGHSPQGVSDAIFDDYDDHSGQPHMASIQYPRGDLISTVFDAIRCLPTSKQAVILLETSLALIEAGQCGVSRLFFLGLSLTLP